MKHSHDIMWCIYNNTTSHQTLPPAGNPEWETEVKTKCNRQRVNRHFCIHRLIPATLWQENAVCIPVLYRLHPLYWHVLMWLCMLKLSVGKGRKVTTTALLVYLRYNGYEHAGYVLYRDLVYPLKYFFIQGPWNRWEMVGGSLILS